MSKYAVKVQKKELFALHLNLFSITEWTFRDSNPGPTGYEPAALTN